MPNPVATSIEVRQFGLAKESVRGTAETAPTEFYGFDKSDEIDFKRTLLEDPAKRGVNAAYPPTPGYEEATGKLKVPARAGSMGEFLMGLIGAPVSAEQLSFLVVAHTVFTVTINVNDSIDFIEGAGTAKSATLTPGAYTVNELCAEIKTQLESANLTVVTYTVAFSTTTKKFTITPSASTVTLLWLTGTNNAKGAYALVGWAKVDAAAAAAQTSTTAVTFAAANDAIPFTEGAGAEKTAYLTAGSYKMGASSAVVGSLCELIKTVMESANGTADVYTVTYSSTTKKLTITNGTQVFVLKWTTGVNANISAMSFLGFTANSASATSAVSDGTAAAGAWKHTFTPGATIQPQSFTFFINRGLSKKQYALGVVSKMVFSGDNQSHILMEADLMAQSEAAYPGTWTPSYSESPILEFYDATVKFAGSAPTTPNVKAWAMTLDPGVKVFRPQSQNPYPQDILAPGPFKASGTMTVYFMDETERAKFLAVGTTSLEFSVVSGSMVNGAVPWSLDVLFDDVRYKAFPFGDEDGYLGAKVTWEAYYSPANTRLFKAEVVNDRVSY